MHINIYMHTYGRTHKEVHKRVDLTGKVELNLRPANYTLLSDEILLTAKLMYSERSTNRTTGKQRCL